MSSGKTVVDYNVARKIPKYIFLAYLIIFTLFGLMVGIKAIADNVGNDKQERTYRWATNQNLFFQGVEENKVLLPRDSPGAKLQQDLKAFVDDLDNGQANPFAPNEIADVYLPIGRYDGLGTQMGWIITDTGQTRNAPSSGYLTDLFINKYDLASAGKSENVMVSAVKPDLGYHLIPFDRSFGEAVLTLILFLQIVALICVCVVQPGRVWTGGGYVQETKQFRVRSLNFAFGWLLAPLIYSFIAINQGFAAVAQKREVKQQQKQAKREQDFTAAEKMRRLSENPVRSQLFTAQRRLHELQNLIVQYPNDETIKEAFRTCTQVVHELEAFPDTLSLASARFIAQESLKEMDLLTKDAEAVLAARRDVGV
jgi:hypothetical protein